jgi:hypothetical protein
MTKFRLFIEGVEVDLFKDEIVTVNSSVANVQDISKVFSDFSQSFLVPATPRNNRIFQHWYESDVNPTVDHNLRRDAFIEIEMQPFRTGKIQLNEAVIKDGQVVSYSVNFFGALVSLKDRFGELTLGDLDYSSVGFTYTGQAVQDRLEDGTTSYNVRFPLISPKRFWNNSGTNDDNIFQATKGISYLELFPAVRVSKIFDIIETQFGITFNSTFFSLSRWTDLYFRHQLAESLLIFSPKTQLNFLSVSPSVSYVDLANNSLTRPPFLASTVEVFLTVELFPSSVTAKHFCEVHANGVLFSTTEFAPAETNKTVATLPSDNSVVYTVFLYSDETTSFDANVEIAQAGGGGVVTITGDTINAVVNISSALNSTMKIYDFFSAVLKAFNLVCVGENETTFTIEPLQDWYELGSEKDLTKYVINSNGIKRLPLYKQIAFKYKQSKSFANKNFLNLFTREYGDLDSSFIYDGSEFKVELPFENNQFVEIDNTNVFCAYCIEPFAPTDTQTKPYIPEPTLLYLNGEETATTAFKLKKESTEVNVTDYAVFNSVNTSGFSLCFGNEFNIVTQETEPNSLYNTYYANHLGNLYDLQQRLFSFTAYLPTGVLSALKLNDKIIIKDKRYLINDISSTLNNGEVKMNLILDLVTIPMSCDCIRVTYTLVGGEPITVEVAVFGEIYGKNSYEFIIQGIDVSLFWNVTNWMFINADSEETQATLSADTDCPFGVYTIEEGSIFSAFSVTNC